VQTSGSGTGAVLTLGTAGSIASLNRSTGGTLNFAVGAGSNVKLPNITLVNPTNPIIGGWAVTGTAAGNSLNFATTDASGNVISLPSYQTMSATPASTDNSFYNATGNSSIAIQANQSVN